MARSALKLMDIDEQGFDEIDRKLLRAIIERFDGGPVGVNTIAAVLSEEVDAIEDMYEPYLLQIGFLQRTPRGRSRDARGVRASGNSVPTNDARAVLRPRAWICCC
jgi:Holliday junction DNA helicase RuvB